MTVVNLPDSFSEAHIDLREYLGDNIFLLQNGDLGVVYQFQGIYDEILTNQQLFERLMSFYKGIVSLTSLPNSTNDKNVTFQIICSQRRIHSPDDPFSYSERQEGRVLSMNEKDLYDQIKLVKRHFYLTIRYTPRKKEETIATRLGKWIKRTPENDLIFQQQRLELCKQEFLRAIKTFENQFDSSFKLKCLDLNDTIQLVQNFLEKRPSNIIPSETNIHENLFSYPIDAQDDHIKIHDNKVQLFYLEQLPGEFRLGQFKYFLDGIPCDEWDLVWGMSHLDKEYPPSLMAREGWYGRRLDKTIFNEFDSFKSQIDSLHPHGVQSVRLITYDGPEDLGGLVSSLALDTIGARLVQEKQILLHLYASSIPLNLRKNFNRIKARYREIRLENAMGFLPAYQGPKDDFGVRWHCSRMLTPTKYDLFAGSGNKMTTVLGMSRAGKSVFLSQMYLEFLERHPEGVIRIIDKKTSSQKLGDLLGGRIIRFSEEDMKKNTYSPFALKSWDEADMEALYLLITTCLMQKNPECNLSGIHSEILKESLKMAYNLHGHNLKEIDSSYQIDPHPVWSDILAQMPIAVKQLGASGIKGLEKAKDDLARWSVSLNQTGQYGFIFSQYETREKQQNDRLLVYDLDGISDPILQQLAGMMAFLKISRDLRKLPLGTPKLIIFEELGMLLIGDERVQKINNEFIQNVVKTCAKYQAQAISITNNVDDYAVKPAGKTIWENATQKIFLPLGNLFPNAHQAWKNHFNEAEWEIIKDLRKETQFKRSNVYIHSENEISPYKGSFIVPLSPAMDALTTTSGPQLQLYNDLKRNGLSTQEALNQMATNHPYGENL